MNRGAFLRRSLAAVGLLSLGRLPDLSEAASGPEGAADGGVYVAVDPASDAVAVWRAPLVASGGLCAPITPYYALGLVSTGRPIASALPTLRADRGGIRYPLFLDPDPPAE